jgi:hypothetical protein
LFREFHVSDDCGEVLCRKVSPGYRVVRVHGPFTVNPVASTPRLTPSAHRTIYENDDRSALRAAILVDVFPSDKLLSHDLESMEPPASFLKTRTLQVYKPVMSATRRNMFAGVN